MSARDIIIGNYSATEDGLTGRVPTTAASFPNLKDVNLVAQEPSPMTDVAEGV
jgi:hypothetical protein